VIGGGVDAGGNVVATTYFGTITGTTIAWVASDALPVALKFLSIKLLANGTIVAVGGDTGAAPVNTIYFGTVVGNIITWVAGTPLPTVLEMQQCNILADGRLLVTGGNIGSGTTIASTWFGVISGTTINWTPSTALPSVLQSHICSALPDGRFLITGGVNGLQCSYPLI